MMSALRVLPLIALLLAVPLAPATGATDDHVSFDQSVYTEQRGDVVSVAVQVSDGANATLNVSSSDTRYAADVVLRDDGDGTVVISWNTYDGTWSADGDDAATVTGATEINGTHETGRYTLTVREGEAYDVSTVVLRERSIRRVGTWVSNDSESFDSAVDVRQATETDRLSLFRYPSANSTFVVEVRGTGLGGAVAAANGSNVTDRVRNAFWDGPASLTIEQHYERPERHPKVIHPDGVTAAYADRANDTYFVVVDPRRATVTHGDDGDDVGFDEGDGPYGVEMEIASSSPLARNGTGEALRLFSPATYTDLETGSDGRIRFRPTANQTVTGTTEVGVGWNVTVRLTDGEGGVLRERSVAVRSDEDSGFRYRDGSFAATFDLRNVSSGTDVTVDVLFRGRSVLDDPVDGHVAAPTATVSVTSTNTSGDLATVRADASLSRGGFVTLHAGSADGPVVSSSDHLGSGNHSVALYVDKQTDEDTLFAVAHRDGNGNERFDGPATDGPYERTDPTGGADVSDWSANETDGNASGGTPTTEDPDESVSLPGFGLSEALIVLAAVALLAVRRSSAE